MAPVAAPALAVAVAAPAVAAAAVSVVAVAALVHVAALRCIKGSGGPLAGERTAEVLQTPSLLEVGRINPVFPE